MPHSLIEYSRLSQGDLLDLAVGGVMAAGVTGALIPLQVGFLATDELHRRGKITYEQFKIEVDSRIKQYFHPEMSVEQILDKCDSLAQSVIQRYDQEIASN